MRFPLICLFIIFSLNSFASKVLDSIIVNEGPHVFLDSELNSFYLIENNQAKILDKVSGKEWFNNKYGFDPFEHLHYVNSPAYTDSYQFNGVENLLAVSDIHGQYDIFKEFLIAHKVIDSNLNWIFGNGHLVVLGDIMDRGDKVTEALWLTFKMESQALKSGGKVHYLTGNHELMVLDNDLRYIHEKYTQTTHILDKSIADLYGKNSLIGQWLGKRPVMVRINDILFVHAGVSPDLVDTQLSIEEVNSLFISDIYHHNKELVREDEFLNFITRTNGPVWYRGYFADEPLPQSKFDESLKFYGVNKIVVGHTSFSEIQHIYQGKLFGIDASLKYGKNGQVLILKNNTLLRGFKDGSTQNF